MVALSLAGALLATEIVLRLWFPVSYRRLPGIPEGHPWTQRIHQPCTTVPGLDYELRPGARGVQWTVPVEINSAGQRGPEPRPAATANLLRIATLGDSIGFGWGVRQEQMFTRILEQGLNARDGRRHEYEVLNFSVTGYNVREEALVLEHKALAFDPDLVLLAYYLNDPEIRPVNALRLYYHQPEWWESFELLRLAAQKQHQWRERHYGGGDYYRWLHHPDTPEWHGVPPALARIVELARAHRLHVVVAIFPCFRDLPDWASYRYDDLHAQVRAAAEGAGAQVLDLAPVFRDSGSTPEELGFDNDHPNAAGHALAARALQEFVLARHLELFGRAP